MRIRTWSLTLIIGLCLTMFPGSLFAAVTVSPVATAVYPGSPITIAGTSDLSEVIIRVTRPDKSILYFNVVKVVNGAYSDTITLGANEVIGAYEIKVGQGEQIQTTTVEVTTRPSSGGVVIVPTDDKVISTDGNLKLPVGKTGEVSLGNEVTISIPANANLKELQLSINKLVDTQSLLTNKEVLASPVFEILKNFTENFSKPVTLTFTFKPELLTNNQKASVFYYDEVKKVWVEVGGKVNGNHITVDVDHFTKYAVMAVDQSTEVPVTTPTTNFSDTSGHWAEAAIKQAVKDGIVTGYPNGTFKPNATVTRAEFAVMLMNALKPQGEGTALTFKDAAKIGAWAQKAVAQAVQAGIISGYSDGTFRPEAEISRAEMASMLAKALGKSGEANAATGFADDKDIPSWAKGSVAIVKQAGIVQGKGDNRFAPQDHATRAEAVTVLLKMLAEKRE